jgi:hypothetical protein
MEEVVLLDNSVGVEIHEDGTVSLDCLVGMISPSGIVGVGKGIIFTLGLSIECSINCMSLFNVIFLHCWAHIQSMSMKGAYATNFHLLHIFTSQRTHKRSKIINFIFKVRNTYLIYSFIGEVSTSAKLF